MPNISLTLPEIDQSVSRPVIFDIVNQLKNITHINASTKVFYPGDIQQMQTPGTSIDSMNERFAIFNTQYITFIDVEEDYDHDTLGSTAVTRKEHLPIFMDTDLGVQVAPVYATSNVTINVKYRCPSKTEALRWRDDMRVRVSQLRDINLHNITYHYGIPIEVLGIIKAIYLLRENYLPYGEAFEAYLRSKASDRLVLVGDLVNQDARLAVSETQTRIVGIYGFEGIPEKPEREESGTWQISFSYRFTYEKPIACNIRYPVMVHNQLLPYEYTDFTNDQYDLSKIDKSYSVSLNALNGFESDTIMQARMSPEPLIRLPDFDDYLITSVPKGTGTVFIALSEVELADQKTLLNLRELDPIVIDSDIMQFIVESELPYICQLYKSIIHFGLYRNSALTSSTTITCDTNLNIKSVLPLNLRNQHRIRMSLVCDLTLLDRSALDRLRKYPKALIKIIAAMNEIFKNHPDFVDLGDKTYITSLEFSTIYAMMTGYALDNGQGSSHQYYGPGRNVNNWPGRGYQGSLFSDIDPRLVEQYRANRVNLNTVQVTGIISFHAP